MRQLHSRVFWPIFAVGVVTGALATAWFGPQPLPAQTGGGNASTDNSGVNGEIAELESDLGQLQSDFLDTQVDLAVTREELADAQSDLAEAQAALAESQTKLADALLQIKELAEQQQQTAAVLATVAETLQYVHVEQADINGLVGPHLIIEGCNVHVRSGGGATDDFETGRGNLIVGYNELFGNNEDSEMAGSRLGSHNLVIGPGHTYASAGGLVAGDNNSLLARHASVTGGFHNSAVAYASAITGGSSNATANDYATVSGGNQNRAQGEFSTVSGGGMNIANGVGSAISGGYQNSALGKASVVSGGQQNTVFNDAESATVSGGFNQKAYAPLEHVP